MKNDIINTYKDIYNLSEIIHKEKVSFNFFRLCKINHNFIVVSIYNERHELLLNRDLNKNIGWELVGGYIKKNERIENAINRIVLKETGLEIDEVQPIAVINNIFEFNGNSITHKGLAFIALSRKQIKEQPENIRMIYKRDIPEEAMMYQNKKVLQIAKEIIDKKTYDPPFYEIDNVKKFFLCHLINKYLVRIVGRLASRKIKNKIIELIECNPNSIVDICCGDDNFIFELENLYNPNVIIANDISWKASSLLRNKKTNILFTNHDVINLPFEKKFDLVIFKNSFHHIDEDKQLDLIKNISVIAKQFIIIDVENPYKSNFLSKLWHFYYLYFLGDKGQNFSTIKDLKKVVEKNIKDKDIKSGIINTIKGDYFYFSLTDRMEKEEVEIKLKLDNVEKIRKILKNLGAIYKDKVIEEDIYFTSIYQDFIKTKECLRIRKRNDYLELTYKGKTTKEMLDSKHFWKSEINIPFLSEIKDMQILLEKIGFKKIAVVNKYREKFILNQKTITIDKIKELGYFLEIEEIVRSKKERERAVKSNINLYKKLGLFKKDIINEPYRDLVIENK